MKAADLPTYYNICEILEHNIGPRGDKTALLSEHGSLTFREVSEQVNKVGNALIRSGVKFGECVAILCPDRPEWVSVFFATAKIGGIALPQRDAITQPRAVDIGLRALKHLRGDIEAIEMRLGVAFRRLDQVAPGTAADLEHPLTGSRCELGNQPVTTEQEVFARRIIDISLAAIYPVHQLRMAAGGAAHAFNS